LSLQGAPTRAEKQFGSKEFGGNFRAEQVKEHPLERNVISAKKIKLWGYFTFARLNIPFLSLPSFEKISKSRSQRVQTTPASEDLCSLWQAL
jgi:hypothetical protein